MACVAPDFESSTGTENQTSDLPAVPRVRAEHGREHPAIYARQLALELSPRQLRRNSDAALMPGTIVSTNRKQSHASGRANELITINHHDHLAIKRYNG